jgi:hypothetical protein
VQEDALIHGNLTLTNPLTLANGGTGAKFEGVPANAIIQKASEGEVLTHLPTANGALYATEANGALQFGTLPVAQGGTGLDYRYTTHSFTINEETVEQLATPLVRYYPYLGLAFIRIAVKTTVSTTAGGTLKLGTLSCQPSYMQPVSGYATKELDAYVSYSDSSVNIKAREAISSGYEIRINGWITIQ